MSDLPGKRLLAVAAAAVLVASGIGAFYWINSRKKKDPTGRGDAPHVAGTAGSNDCITLAASARSRGNKYYNAGRFDDALKCYSEAISLYPVRHGDLSLAYSNRAAAHLSLQDYESAFKDCESALAINPKNIKALDRRARILQHLGNTEDALVDAVAAAVVDGFKAESLVLHVEDLLKKLSEVKAKELFQTRKPTLATSWVISRFLHSFPREWDSLSSTSVDGGDELSPFFKLLLDEEYEAALELICKTAGAQPSSKSADLFNWQGTMLFLSGSFEAARDAFKKAISLEPASVAPRVKLALVAMELGHYTDMTESLEAAEKIDDTDASIFYHRAEILAHNGDLNNAVAAFSRAIQLDAEFIDAYVHLGRAYMAMNMVQAARDFIDKALKLFPDNPELLHVRGECFAMESRMDKSLELFDLVIGLAPDFPQAHLSRAFIMSMSGGSDEDLGRELEAIVGRFPGCDAAHVQLAGYHMEKKRTTEALRHYDIAAEHARSYQELVSIYTLRAISSSQAKVTSRYPELADAMQEILRYSPSQQ